VTSPRLYAEVCREHVREHRQMLLVSGPRQVGKTTLCREVAPAHTYLTWDDPDDRRILVRGPSAIAAHAALEQASREPRVLVLDELHKFAKWKTLLKGLFDRYGTLARILVTGSSRLDVYRRGGDSLMGRTFHLRVHPFSVGEVVRPRALVDAEVHGPMPIGEIDWRALLEHGGFPEPFVRRERRFSNRWRGLRREQLVREEVRDTTRIHEVGQLAVLVELLEARSGTALSYSSLAREVQVSVDTARRWVDALAALHHGFLVRPWFRNVTKSLRKEPKWYVRDWSVVEDVGQRAETLVACHLLKAVDAWTDLGLGRYELRYLRDKDKREVDFLVVRGGKPWFLVEVKSSDTSLSPALAHFQAATGAPHAFQAVVELPPVGADAFRRTDPVVVSARDLLSQLP
jgi:predicted AAA+ superfamily ATPase